MIERRLGATHMKRRVPIRTESIPASLWKWGTTWSDMAAIRYLQRLRGRGGGSNEWGDDSGARLRLKDVIPARGGAVKGGARHAGPRRTAPPGDEDPAAVRVTGSPGAAWRATFGAIHWVSSALRCSGLRSTQMRWPPCSTSTF